MEIRLIESNKKRFLDLLLLADEQEDMIDRYLEQGDVFALYDGDLKSIAVVIREDETTCELKNLATYAKYRGRGYGMALIRHIADHYRGRCGTLLVGTGDVPRIVSFYEKCGFELSHRHKNFFTDNYDHPMVEDGVQLVDMVYLKMSL